MSEPHGSRVSEAFQEPSAALVGTDGYATVQDFGPVATPWGDSDGLRARRLPPGPGTPPERVARNQRQRLMAATVAVVERRGYGAATVADLVALSGVSRSAFYRHFANKEACFLATAEAVIEAALAVVASRYRRDRDWEERARDALRSFLALLGDQPAASRLVMVESYAAGPAATDLVERATAGFEALAREALEQLPGREGMPPEMVRAGIGGLREAIQARLWRRAEGELDELEPALLEAMLAYRAPPLPLPTPAARPARRPSAAARPLPRDPDDPAERIVAAAAATMAAQGYAASTLDAIVAAASVSLSTLYEHFDGKEAVLAAVLDAGQARMFAAAAPAYRRARSWPEGVRAALAAIFRFLAAEPEFARLGAVEVFAAGRWALARREQTMARFTRFLAPGLERAPEARSIAAEIAVGSVLAIIAEAVRADRVGSLPERVPLATYIVLSPFLGAADACAVARGAPAGG